MDLTYISKNSPSSKVGDELPGEIDNNYKSNICLKNS